MKKKQISGLLVSIIFLLFFSALIFPTETLCYKERITSASSFNIYTGKNDPNNPIIWTHNVPVGILDSVVRVGLYIEAYDVDYPANDEHDRVYINGNDIGLLEGFNNTWITVEKTIPVAFLKEGVNEIKIVVDELDKNWKVTIRASELRFYCSVPDPDFSLGSDPLTNETSSGGSVDYTISLTSLNGFNSPVTLSLEDLPAQLSGSFSQNPVTPNPVVSSTLTITTDPSITSGDYKFKIKGEGGGQSHTLSLTLTIKCSDFDVGIKADPKTGDAPLAVQFMAVLSGKTYENSPGWKFSWDFGDGEKSIEQNPEHYYSVPGHYQVRLDVQDPCNISKSAKITIVVNVNKDQVELLKTVDKTSAQSSDILNYQIILTNNSAGPLTKIEISDELADELEIISQISNFSYINKNGILYWKGDLAAKTKETISFKAKINSWVTSGTKIQNRAELTAREIDNKKKSNVVVTTVASKPISPTNIFFRKKTNFIQTKVGGIIRFEITIQNNSNSKLFNPVINDFFPLSFSYVKNSAVLNNGSLINPIGKNPLVWQLPDIVAGGRYIIRYQTVIGSDAARGKNITRALLNTTDSSGQRINLESTAFVNISGDGLIFYSGIEGKVFLDRDNDQFYSTADTLVEGVEVYLSTGQKTTTDLLGHFIFISLFPGEYAVGVNRATLPAKFEVVPPGTRIVYLMDGLLDYVELSLKFRVDTSENKSRLEGKVFFDKNRDNQYDPGDILVRDFQVCLDEKQTTKGSDGSFVFTRIDPGNHKIEIKYGDRSVIKEIKLIEGTNIIDIPLVYSGIKIVIRGKK